MPFGVITNDIMLVTVCDYEGLYQVKGIAAMWQCSVFD